MGTSIGFGDYHKRRLGERWHRVLVRYERIGEAMDWLDSEGTDCSFYYNWVGYDDRWHVLINDRYVAFECKLRFG